MINKPDWLRVSYSENKNTHLINELLNELRLNTVCNEANCPNRIECFSNKTATFMILGTICTRKCSFCNVSHGCPAEVDLDEPARIAAAVAALDLRYVVITSVTRDDLPDGGALHFARVISAIHDVTKKTAIEVLIPDLTALKSITDESPNVISHNIETVASLYVNVRPEANYKRSLNVLKIIKQLNPDVMSKSGIMLGLGETKDEVYKTFDDLLENGCELLTIGQYLSPSKNHYPVHEYITPQAFDEYGVAARKKGFRHVASAPLVRSSYHADKALIN